MARVLVDGAWSDIIDAATQDELDAETLARSNGDAASLSTAESYAAGIVGDLSGVTDPATARTNLGLGTAALSDDTDFDAAGAASTAQAAAISTAASDATTKANAAQAYAIQRANHTGTQSADTLTDGTTNKAFLATERTKLSGIATSATANSSDATLLARANHTGTQTAATISDFNTAVATTAELIAGHTAKSVPVSDSGSLADLVMAASTMLARLASGGIVAATPTQIKTLLAIASTDVSGLGTLATQSGTFSGTHSGTSSGTNTGDQTITLTGDVTGSGPGSFAATLKNTGGGAAGPTGSATVSPIVTVDAQGRVTALSSATIAIPESAVTNLTTDLAAKAALASPTFTGTPAAPTAAQGTSTTQLATTAMVQSEVTLLAPKASPALTGNPTAPTASPGDNDTSIATTAFVTAAVAAGGGGSGSAISRSITQAAHGFAVGDVVYLASTTYTKAIATSAAAAEVVGMVSTVTDANTFTLTSGGRVTGLTGLTAGTVYFLSPSSAGTLTATEPTTAGYISKPLLVADTTTTGYFYNFRGVTIGATATGSLIGYSNVDTGESTASSTFTDLATVGPSVTFTVPAGQTWDVVVDFAAQTSNSAAGTSIFAVAVDGATPLDIDSARSNASTVASIGSITKFASLAAGSHTIKMQYRSSSGSQQFIYRKMKVSRLA